MNSKTIYFWVIDNHIYAETDPEFESAFSAKCAQWNKEHPNGCKDIMDPSELENYIVGGQIRESEKYGKTFVSLDPMIPNELIPQIRSMFHLDSIEHIQYCWNGSKKCYFNFGDWFQEHPEWSPCVTIKTKLPTVEQLGKMGKIEYIPVEEVDDGNMKCVRYIIERQL